MIFAFLDECGDEKRPDYFGLSLAIVNLNFYRALKEETHSILLDAGWKSCTEFKGSYLFSAKKGCAGVKVEKRVEAASKILRLTAAEKNKRIKFYYLRLSSTRQGLDYLKYTPLLLRKAVPFITSKKGGKNIVAVFCDQRSDISIKDVRTALHPVLKEKGYTLFEDVFSVASHFETIGILFADVVGYPLARIDTISEDKELFENIPPEQLETNGKLRKLQSSKGLINLVRDIKRFAEVTV